MIVFDVEKYKEDNGDLLHVVIDKDGNIINCGERYLNWLVNKLASEYNISVDMVASICPYTHPIQSTLWLCDTVGVVIVDNKSILYTHLTQHQIEALQVLKENDLYLGDIPYDRCN